MQKKYSSRFQEQNPYVQKDDYKLSDREKEVLTCLMKGMSYKMIAAACYIRHRYCKISYQKDLRQTACKL
jgi:DNA-binding NarL/FixJ family response regulator